MSMVFMSLWYVFGQVTSVYPKPMDRILLKCHRGHKGLDCAFGFALVVCAGGGNTLGSQAGE